METKIDAQRLELVRNKCGFTSGLCRSNNGRSSGMGLWWREVDVSIYTFSNHHIEFNVRGGGGSSIWKGVGIYGWPEASNKRLTWELMKNIANRNTLPIMMFGDFNEILGGQEKEGGVIQGERQIDAFRDAIEICGCQDLGYSGSTFTWQWGLTIDTLVRERLDRFLADNRWCTMFQIQ